ncbi:MAG: hypothetical protein AAGB04_29180 [Pseudomonadota bacterium]
MKSTSIVAVISVLCLTFGCSNASDTSVLDDKDIEYVPTAGTSLNCSDAIVVIDTGSLKGNCFVIDYESIGDEGFCGDTKNSATGNCWGKDGTAKCGETKGAGKCEIKPKPKPE